MKKESLKKYTAPHKEQEAYWLRLAGTLEYDSLADITIQRKTSSQIALHAANYYEAKE